MRAFKMSQGNTKFNLGNASKRLFVYFSFYLRTLSIQGNNNGTALYVYTCARVFRNFWGRYVRCTWGEEFQEWVSGICRGHSIVFYTWLMHLEIIAFFYEEVECMYFNSPSNIIQISIFCDPIRVLELFIQ